MPPFIVPEGQHILNEEERQYRARGLIYYVSTKSVKNYPVKIGRTTQGGLGSRMSQLQIAMPYQLDVLMIHPGGAADELRIHDMFGRFRVRGEWFDRHDALTAWLNDFWKEHKDWEAEYLTGRRWREATSRAELLAPRHKRRLTA